MKDVTRLLSGAEAGDAAASAELLPLVYDELRRLAAARLGHEGPGQTLQPTALVHEAFLRLLGADAESVRWDHRGHFFAAAAEAMRRILIENARRKRTAKHGGAAGRVELPEGVAAAGAETDSLDLLALDDALAALERADPAKAALVKLRYFAGLTMPQAAAAAGVSLATAERHWAFAKAWLYSELGGPG